MRDIYFKLFMKINILFLWIKFQLWITKENLRRSFKIFYEN